jgi:hypothetical protein
MNWIIYVLKHPRTGEVRYVGWTNKKPHVRLNGHLSEATQRGRTHKQRWIRSLVCIGLHPVIEPIESGSGDGWFEAERRWIVFYRANDARLVNATDGGEGVVGWGTFEQRRAVSRVAQKHANMTPELRRVRQIAALARKTSAEISLAAKQGQAGRTPEERRISSRIANSAITPEQRVINGKKANASISPEGRLRAAAQWKVTMTPEKLSERSKKGWAMRMGESRKSTMTREQRTARSQKLWATRRKLA